MTTTTDLRIERSLGAPPESVYAAWTETATMERWYCPNPALSVTVTSELVVGGPYRVQMGRHVAEGVYTELSPHRVVAFTWAWDHEPATVSQVRVELTPDGAGTRLVLTQTGLAGAEDVEGHEEGWGLSIARLVEVVAGH